MLQFAPVKVVFIDSATAAALAQILPLLLLSLMVELRRTELHLRGRHRNRIRGILAAFFFVFGIVEMVLVMSIDGEFIPFTRGDLLAGLTIFGLLGILFALSMMGSPKRGKSDESEDGG